MFLIKVYYPRTIGQLTNLIVEGLEPLDPVHHWLQLNPLEVIVHTVNPLNSENVVAKVEALKPDYQGQDLK